MKQKFWYRLGLIVTALLTVSLAVILAHPSDATRARNQQMLNLHLIDEVRSAQDLGLDYLMQESDQLMAGIVDNIRYAEAEITQMTQDIKVAFDLGTNDPIRIGALPDQGQLTRRTDYQAVGYIDSFGTAKGFTPAILATMFNVEANKGGQLVMTPEAEQILVADASGSFLQEKRVPTFDLIVHSKRERKLYLVSNVNANAVCRDALNAVFNSKLNRLGFDFEPTKPGRAIPLW
jgi:hypothetical protein